MKRQSTGQTPDRDAPQVNLDEMVPDRRVFTQMVAFELGDKTLNRLNQLHATEESAAEPAEDRKDRPPMDPLPLRIVKATLTGVGILSILLFCVLAFGYGFGELIPDFALLIRDPLTRTTLIVFAAALLLRVGISGVQRFAAYRRWLRTVRGGGA